MQRLKLMTIVGTRPEIIKLSETIKLCDLYFDHVLVHTGQHYDTNLSRDFFTELGIRVPDHFLGVADDNLGRMLGNIIAGAYAIMQAEKPDALLVLGDTNSCLSVIAAKRLKIPIFHMEAGNRCFDENLPEEANRRIIDITSDVNLCYTEHARRHMLAAGMRPAYTFVTGSPMAEVLGAQQAAIDASSILTRLSVEQGRYLVLSAHREENITNPASLLALMDSINAAAEAYSMPILYSAHPRSRQALGRAATRLHPAVRMLSPMGFADYVQLQRHAFCVLSDSGTLSEESAYYHFPAVSLRTSTERPEGLEASAYVVAGIRRAEVLQAIALAVAMRADGKAPSPVPGYTDTSVAMRTINIIQSYTHIIHRDIWRKG